jgi:hypothetical protein
MKLRTSLQNAGLWFILVIAFSPHVQAADTSDTMVARAIGGETPAAPPPKREVTPPPQQGTAKATGPAEDAGVAEEGPTTTKGKVGIGIAIAVGLAALGGGGGSSSPAPHPN